MELEFDKEIDLLLRKADRGVLVGDKPHDKPKVHLDADELAAFVENAMPEKTRALHMAHLADCGHCRRILSGLIALSAEDAAEEMRVAAPAVSTASVEPWYRRFLLFPNLAYVMGGLVLVFGGLLTFSVLQTSQREAATVSQATEGETGRGPMEPASSSLDSTNQMSLANSAANTYTFNSNAAVSQNVPSNSAANTSSNTSIIGSALAPRGEAEDAKPVVRERGFSIDGADAPAAGVTAAPPPPVPAAQPQPKDAEVAVTDATTTAAKEESKLLQKKRSANEKDDLSLSARQVQESPRTQAGGPMKSKPGPSRDAQQNFPNRANNTYDLPTMKRVSGKSFEFRNNVWYDISYRGQATKNVRRGTDEYRDLDKGLRSIAESLSGVVVAVWEGKAYRIQ